MIAHTNRSDNRSKATGMAVRIPNFDELEGTVEFEDDFSVVDFCWPAKGDKLFLRAENWRDDALLNQELVAGISGIADGYKKAADHLVRETRINAAIRHFFVYPIIFCYRHYLELCLKHALDRYGATAGINKNWDSHTLKPLWADYKRLIEKYRCLDTSDEAVGELVREFAKVDPGSSTFRYPVDRKGVPIRINFNRVDLGQLADRMKDLEEYFVGMDGFLSEMSAPVEDIKTPTHRS